MKKRARARFEPATCRSAAGHTGEDFIILGHTLGRHAGQTTCSNVPNYLSAAGKLHDQTSTINKIAAGKNQYALHYRTEEVI